jgi:hypothetical protein
MTRRVLLTLAVAVYVLAAVCGQLVLAALLPGLWAVLVLPLGVVNGLIAGDMLGTIWKLQGQYDDGRDDEPPTP